MKWESGLPADAFKKEPIKYPCGGVLPADETKVMRPDAVVNSPPTELPYGGK